LETIEWISIKFGICVQAEMYGEDTFPHINGKEAIILILRLSQQTFSRFNQLSVLDHRKHTDVSVNVTNGIFIVETITREAIFVPLRTYDLESRASVCVNSISHEDQKEFSLFFQLQFSKICK